MIQGFLKNLRNRIQNLGTRQPTDNTEQPQDNPPFVEPPRLQVVPRDHHVISRNDISPSALKVMYRLNGANYQSYLVGGGVRDLLLRKQPKDFDIATDAHPEEVNKLFRNSRLIGRRFKLVHILFGREVIEVATFRGEHKEEEHEAHQSSASEHGMLLRDNVYGTMEEDAIRRDFTVNALYYCVKDFSIYDYTGGLEDIRLRQIRLIGDPETRYREDPVRMLRAVRFANKLNFTIHSDTEKPIKELAELLDHIPAARLFEEVLKLFLGGDAERNFNMLQSYGLLRFLFPFAAQSHLWNNEFYTKFWQRALLNTDKRISEDRPVTPAFLYAALLWPSVLEKWEQYKSQGVPEFPALQQAGQKVLSQQLKATSLPKRFNLPMKEIWELQLRLPKRHGHRADQCLEHPRFRAAYDFLLLREAAGEDTGGLGQWWTHYQENNPDNRRQQVKELSQKTPGKRRSKRRYNNRPGKRSQPRQTGETR